MRKGIIIVAIVAALVGAAAGLGGRPADAQGPQGPAQPPRICFGPNNPCLAAPVLKDTTYPVWVNCTSTGQLCSPAFTLNVEVIAVLDLVFTASPQHCSDIRLHVFLDGQRLDVFTRTGQGPTATYAYQPATTFLAPGQSSRDANLIWKFTGTNTPTTYQLSIQAEGRAGGCNTGTLSSWGGTLRVRTFVRP